MTDTAAVRSWLEEHVPGITWNGTEGTGRCPLHDDKNPSAGFNYEKISWICRAGCGEGKLSDLAARMGWPWPFNGTGGDTVYIYRGADGAEAYRKNRYSKDGKKQFAFEGRTKDTAVPYNLPKVVAALKCGEPVCIVEGEKDADTLAAWGFVATTNDTGAGHWGEAESKWFPIGAAVYILGDADLPGQEHIKMVSAALRARGCIVHVVDLGFPVEEKHGKDVTDWKEAGHSRGELLNLLAIAKPLKDAETVPKAADDKPQDFTAPAAKPEPYPITTLEQIFKAPPAVQMIDGGILYRKTLNLTGSAPGAGKTINEQEKMIALAKGRGHSFLGQFPVLCGPQIVLAVDEENPDTDINDHLRGMGAAAGMPIYFLHYCGIKVDRERDFDRLLATIEKVKPDYISFDALIRFHGAKESDSQEMSFIMEQFRKIVNMGITVNILHHHGWVAERSRGSSDITAAVDFEYSIVKRGEEPDDYLVFSTAKARRAPVVPFRMKIQVEDGHPRMKYMGSDIVTRADVRESIIQLLRGGKKSYKDIFDGLKEAGMPTSNHRLREILPGMVGKEIQEDNGEYNRKTYSVFPPEN